MAKEGGSSGMRWTAADHERQARALVRQLEWAEAERDRYREALDTVAFHHDISEGALGYLQKALDG
jgi:hypothetical protein